MIDVLIFFLRKIAGAANKVLHRIEKNKFVIKENNHVHLLNLVYQSIPEIKPISAIFSDKGSPRIILLLPGLHSTGFYGGVATALLVAIKFAVINERDLLIVETLASGHADKNLLEKFYIDKGVDIKLTRIEVINLSNRTGLIGDENINVHYKDLFIASAWGDAWIASKLNIKNKFLYLVQDYEPIFYPNSDRYVMAESTYHFNNYIPLCNTYLMHEHMTALEYSNFTKHRFWFEPAVSNVLTGLIRPASKRRIFLYGRPAVARNMFHSAMLALQEIFVNNELNKEEWEIYMAGQDDIENIFLTDNFYIKNLGKMELNDYISFSKSIDVAISLMMAPHPNYPTLEFASIGTAVVTTKYSVKNSLQFYSENIIMADLSVNSIKEAIIEAAGWTVEKRLAAVQRNNILTDWGNALDSVVDIVSKEFTQLA